MGATVTGSESGEKLDIIQRFIDGMAQGEPADFAEFCGYLAGVAFRAFTLCLTAVLAIYGAWMCAVWLFF